MWLTSHPRSTLFLLDTGASGTNTEMQEECLWKDLNPRALDYKSSALSIQLRSSKLVLGKSRVHPDGVFHRYISLIIYDDLWLTSYPRSTLFLLDT